MLHNLYGWFLTLKCPLFCHILEAIISFFLLPQDSTLSHGGGLMGFFLILNYWASYQSESSLRANIVGLFLYFFIFLALSTQQVLNKYNDWINVIHDDWRNLLLVPLRELIWLHIPTLRQDTWSVVLTAHSYLYLRLQPCPHFQDLGPPWETSWVWLPREET